MNNACLWHGICHNRGCKEHTEKAIATTAVHMSTSFLFWMQNAAFNLLFAGHDTSASVLMLLLRYLRLCPQTLEKLRNEQSKVLPSSFSLSSAKFGMAVTSCAATAGSIYEDIFAMQVMQPCTIMWSLTATRCESVVFCGCAWQSVDALPVPAQMSI